MTNYIWLENQRKWASCMMITVQCAVTQLSYFRRMVHTEETLDMWHSRSAYVRTGGFGLGANQREGWMIAKGCWLWDIKQSKHDDASRQTVVWSLRSFRHFQSVRRPQERHSFDSYSNGPGGHLAVYCARTSWPDGSGQILHICQAAINRIAWVRSSVCRRTNITAIHRL